jgi:ATP-dependent helicase HrpB
MQSLPIDELLAPILQILAVERRLVLQAPPGTGKSTRLPPALLKSVQSDTQILVAEPRRIAARLLANRVALELGQRVGGLVGYRVRFEDVSGLDTRLLYLTSGVLLRRILADPLLSKVSCVVIDEFHERHLDTDLALALALRAQQTVRPDLIIAVMSATLQGEAIRTMMGSCSYIRSEQENYPISIEYSSLAEERPLEKQVVSAVRDQLRKCPSGNILVFLPGAGEIRRASEALLSLATERDLDVLPLHGDMPLHKQALALQPGNRRRVVLATNVAESSITVPGIVGVVDSGLARTAGCSPWSGLPTLEVQKISKASATQRAGRAGRLSAGIVTRLYTRADFELRAEFDTPEMLRLDLCEAVLLTRGVGVKSLGQLPLVDYPPQAPLQAAEQLLKSLGAVTATGDVSELGEQMLRLPVHPRLARLAIESHRRGVTVAGSLAAALLSERDVRTDARVSVSSNRPTIGCHTGNSDIEELIEAYEFAASHNFEPNVCARERIDARVARSVADAQRQLQRKLRGIQASGTTEVSGEWGLEKSLLLAFPDRVAWRRETGRCELVLVNGNTAQLSDQSVVRDARYLLALMADERSTRGRKASAIVRVACRIDPNWLLELLADKVIAEEDQIWANPPGRVETISKIRYGAIVLDESRAVAQAGPAVAELLADTAERQGLLSGDALASLKERIRLLVEFGLLPESDLLTDANVRSQVVQMCSNQVSLDAVTSCTIAAHSAKAMSPTSAKILRELAPEDCRLVGGRAAKVHYEPGRGPWLASRLQDFFGMSDTPRICGGRQPLTLHLLAPNQRAVQITQDLCGFWERHYPSIRRELMRRYPKHQWPEDGRVATSPRSR